MTVKQSDKAPRDKISNDAGPGGGGYSTNVLLGVCGPNHISVKTLCDFQYPILDLIEKSIPHYTSLK